jgi:hypothetical protein
MLPIRKLLIVGVGVLALYGVQACTSETELNPQPLPPGGEPARTPDEKSDDQKNGEATGLGGGSPPPAPADAADGGAADGGPG